MTTEARKMTLYCVWRASDDASSARLIAAASPEHAVRMWAEWADSHSADYSIVRGEEEHVYVQVSDEEPQRFVVTGESVPVYYVTPGVT